MKLVFEEIELEELYIIPMDELKGKQKYPLEVIKQYKKKVAILIGIKTLDSLKAFRSLNFEYLKGNLKGQCSIRLNNQYRLLFIQTKDELIQVLLITEISKYYE